jgi:hypothetical protein
MDTNLIGLHGGPPAQEPSVGDVSRDAQRAHDIAGPAPRPVPRPEHGPRAGWLLSTVVAVGAAWVAGWVVGVSWAWRQMSWHWW